MTRPALTPRRALAVVLPIAVALLAPAVLPAFGVRIGLTIFLYAGLALSWYILGGFTAYYSFGHTAFVGAGAFAAAMIQARLALPSPQLVLAIAVLGGAGAAGLIAAVLAYPILRLRGHYFTIAMLAVALVLGELVNSLDVFQGSTGLTLRAAQPTGMRPEIFYYYVILAALLVTVGIAAAIRRSRLGYGLLSIREDEEAAEMLGVATVRYKIVSFLISATLAGLFGALFAYNLGYITTDSVFRASISLDMIVFSLVGGMGSLAGPIVGAAVMTLLTKVALGNLLEFHLAITGAAILVIVLVAPRGIVGLFQRRTARLRPADA